jgi:spore maturation protein CgeB
MKLLIVDALYQQNLARFFAANPEIARCSYDRQLAAVTRDSGVCAAWWLVRELNLIPGASAVPVIANAELLQRAWAREAKIDPLDGDWFHDILLHQISLLRPEVLVVFPASIIRPGFVRMARSQCPTLQCAVAWDGVGACSEVLVEEYDVILSCLAHVTGFYRARGKASSTLATGFDPSVKDQLHNVQPQYDTVFVGSLRGDAIYAERFRLLLETSRRRHIDLWLSNFPDWQPWSRMQVGLLRRLQWRRFKEIWELGKRNKGSRFGKEMFQILGQARICLNQHGNTGGDSAGNRRLWEATGVGTCLLTDWRPNLHELFRIDEEIVTYRGADECVEKIDYLLSHEDHRRRIAEAGMKRTHKDYSTARFAEALLSHLDRDRSLFG